MKRSLLVTLTISFVLSLFFSPRCLLAAPYYEGKVLTMLVGFTPGGGYDRMSRLLAKYLPKYIPGKPTIVVQNMGGASSIIGANYLYNIAKPNGLTIGTFNRALPFAPVVKLESIKFDITKYAWIGSTAVESTVFCVRTDLPYKTAQDLLRSKEVISMASSGTGSSDYQFATLIKEFLGVNINIINYPGSAESMLAVERKEADGRSGSYTAMKPYIERGLVRPLIRGRVPDKGIENLPVNEDLTTNKTGKAIMAMYSAADLVGRPYVAPPGTPADLVKILRNALAQVCKDPEMLKEAGKLMIEIQYVPAEQVLKVIYSVLNQPENIKKEFAKYVKF
jgi:tripartite-type tricarboxylate transporter receptor subunit TctC